jgi:hypothetical protein
MTDGLLADPVSLVPDPPCVYSGLAVDLPSSDRAVAARCTCGARVTVVDGRIPMHVMCIDERP